MPRVIWREGRWGEKEEGEKEGVVDCRPLAPSLSLPLISHTHLPQRAHALAQQVDAAVVVALQGLGVDLRETKRVGVSFSFFDWGPLL